MIKEKVFSLLKCLPNLWDWSHFSFTGENSSLLLGKRKQAIEVWGKEEDRGMFMVMMFVFKVAVICDETLLSRKWLNICLPMGNSEWIPYYVLPTHAVLLRLLNYILIHRFSAFVLLILIPILLGMNEWLDGCLGWGMARVNPPQAKTKEILSWVCESLWKRSTLRKQHHR